MTLAIPEFPEFDLALSKLQGEKLAVYEKDKESQTLYLIGLNIITPGAFAVALEQQKVKAENGVMKPVMREGGSLELLRRICFDFPDLLTGAPRAAIAEYLEHTEYDERTKGYTRQITAGVGRGLGVEMGWHSGRFRILTARQVALKADQQVTQIIGKMETVNRWQTATALQGIQPKRRQALRYTEMPLFDLAPPIEGGLDDD